MGTWHGQLVLLHRARAAKKADHLPVTVYAQWIVTIRPKFADRIAGQILQSLQLTLVWLIVMVVLTFAVLLRTIVAQKMEITQFELLQSFYLVFATMLDQRIDTLMVLVPWDIVAGERLLDW